MKVIALFLLMLGYPFLGTAQVDSLQRKLSTSSGKQRLSILNNLIAVDSTSRYKAYSKEALQLARELNDVLAEAAVWGAQGDHFININDFASALLSYKEALRIVRMHRLVPETVYYLDRCAASWEGLASYDNALHNYTEALNISKKLKLPGTSGLLERIGLIHFDNQQFDEALIRFKEALTEDRQSADSTGIAADLNNIGLAYYNQAQYDSSTRYLAYALKYYQHQNDKQNIAQIILNIGINYREQGSYDLALSKILSAARYFEDVNDSTKLASCYNTVANIQMEMGSFENSLLYHFKALDIRQQIGNKRGIAGSLTNIGNVYKQQKKYDKSLEYLLQSLKIKEDLGDKKLVASSLDQLGEVYFLLGKDREAEKFYLRSVALKKEVGDRKGIAQSCNNLGDLYLRLKQYADAGAYLDEARRIGESTGAKDVLLSSYKTSARLCREQGKAELALEWYDKYYALKDSIFSEQKNEALAEMQVKYETERKEQKILLLSEKQKSQAALMQKQYTTIYSLAGGAVLLLIIAFISFKSYRSYKKANVQSQVIISQKQELIEQKQVMMRELHHRVKNNLQLLSGLLSLQRNRVQQSPAQQALQAVDHRLKAMLLIHRELYLDKQHDSIPIRQYIRQLTENLVSAFGYPRNSIDIILDVEDIEMNAEKALNLGLIINEVVSNSFKHAFGSVQKPLIYITLRSVAGGKLALVIKDNGPGIPPNSFPKDSFGLSLVDMLSREMKGSLEFTSMDGARMELII